MYRILFTIVFFGKEKNNAHQTFHILRMKAHFKKEPHFWNKSSFRNPVWKWKHVFGKWKVINPFLKVGSDVAIAYKDGLLGYIDDYNITAKSPCSGILGVKKGVCLDGEAHTGGSNNNQIQVSKKWLNFYRIL